MIDNGKVWSQWMNATVSDSPRMDPLTNNEMLEHLETIRIPGRPFPSKQGWPTFFLTGHPTESLFSSF